MKLKYQRLQKRIHPSPAAKTVTMDYADQTVTELKVALDGLGIKYAANAKKAELIALLGG